ncbi:MAG: sensor histidine kinase [Bdellovibrionia bacterium]
MLDPSQPRSLPPSLKPSSEDLLSSITHDLRGPLTAARANAEILLKTIRLEHDAQILIQRVLRNIDRVDQLIQHYLDTRYLDSRLSSQMNMTSCDLTLLMKDVLEDLGAIYGNRFIFSTNQSHLGFWSPHDLRRVIENLASNAIKYGDRESLITLKLHETESDVRLSVHNHGPPIPPDQQKLIFNPFHRSQPNHAQGWGLGLSIIQAIVKAHGGFTQVESSQEQGTTFSVILPKDCRKKPNSLSPP